MAKFTKIGHPIVFYGSEEENDMTSPTTSVSTSEFTRAIINSDHEALKIMILDRNAKVDSFVQEQEVMAVVAKTQHSGTPLMWVIENTVDDELAGKMVCLLLQYGADKNIRESPEYVIAADKRKTNRISTLLKDHGGLVKSAGRIGPVFKEG